MTAPSQVGSSTITTGLNPGPGTGPAVMNLSSASTGEKRILFIGIGSTTTVDGEPSGFTKIAEDATQGFRALIYERVVVGGDGSTATISTSSGAACASICFTTSGSMGVCTAGVATSGGSPSANPNPPNLAPGGTTDRLYFTVAFVGDSSVTVSAVPSGYGTSSYGSESGGFAPAGIILNVNVRSSSATSPEDPSAYTISVSSENWVAMTLQDPGTDGGGGAALSIAAIIQNYRNMGLH